MEATGRALALLEATHQFPCAYSVTVIAFNQETVTAAIRLAAYHSQAESAAEGGEAGAEYQSQESRAGKYRSHRIAVTVPDAPAVLALYARLRAVEGVVTLL